MNDRKRSYQDKKVRVDTVGKVYRDSKRRMDISEIEHTVQNNRRQYDHDATYVKWIDRILNDCDQSTRLIIRNEFLSVNDPNWYRNYFSQETYYRRRKKAVEQFDSLLNF